MKIIRATCLHHIVTILIIHFLTNDRKWKLIKISSISIQFQNRNYVTEGALK